MSMFEGQVTTLAFCWRLDRSDGAGLALTSHDQPLDVGDVRFQPAPGMTPAVVHSQLGLDGKSSEVAGWLTSSAISEADIVSGRWDGASLMFFAVDWTDPNAEQHVLLEGALGQVTARDGQFEAELLGAAAKLERPVCPVTSPECRAELGDRDCRIDMAERRVRARVVTADGGSVMLDRPVDDRFRFGTIRFLDGAANGLKSRVISIDGAMLSAIDLPSCGIDPGTQVELIEGCDKRLETCAERFANAANFRGEPHLPGNDLLTRYSGS